MIRAQLMRVMRRPRTWIIAGVVLVALAGLVLTALPTVARRIAVSQLRAVRRSNRSRSIPWPSSREALF